MEPTEPQLLKKQEHRVTSLQLGQLENAPFVSYLPISVTGGVPDQTMLCGYGGIMYAPVLGGTEVYGRTMQDELGFDRKIRYRVCDVREIGGRRKVLGLSQSTIVLGTESQAEGDGWLVQTGRPGEHVRAALLGATDIPDGRNTQKVLLVTRYKKDYDQWNDISIADLSLENMEPTAQNLKSTVHVTGLWPIQFENNQAMALIAHSRGDDSFIDLVDPEGNLSQQQVSFEVYPAFVTQGTGNSILAVTLTGNIIRGNITAETDKEPRMIFEKLKIPQELVGSVCRVFPAGDDKLLLVGKDGTVSLVNPETGVLIAQLVHDELKKALEGSSPGSLIHTYEALPTGPNEWAIFVCLDDLQRNKRGGKSFSVSAR